MQKSFLKTLELVRTYPILISDDRINDLITWYLKTLQKAIDIIWNNIEWKYNFPKVLRSGRVKIGKKLRIPVLPKSNSFKKQLRDELLKECPYAKHWVDAVIRTAYSIMKSWRKRYTKGKARRDKPKVKKRFARCKITLMKIDYENKKIRITLKPYEYFEVSWERAWFSKRVNGWSVGEVILKDDRILIPFENNKIVKVDRVVGWDSNELTLDGYEPNAGFTHVDLRYIQSIKIVYEAKKAITQSISKRDLYEKYAKREKYRERDFINKMTSQLTRLFPNTIHVFEDLNKSNLVEKSKIKVKRRRKRNARTPWRSIHRRTAEIALTGFVPPKNTSRKCPKCGYVIKTREGRIFRCPRCGFKMDRQKTASINIRKKYIKKSKLKMWGFPHTNEPEPMRVEVWVGVTLNGRRPMIWWGDERPRLRLMRPRRRT